MLNTFNYLKQFLAVVLICFIFDSCTLNQVPKQSIDNKSLINKTKSKNGLNLVEEARSLIKKKEFASAIPLLEKSLTEYKKNDSVLCSEILIMIGNCYKEKKQIKESEHAYQSALNFDQKKHSEISPYVSRDLNHLAVLYLTTLKYYRALKLIEKAIEIDRKIYSRPHFDIARDLTVKAIIYERLGQYNNAIIIQKEVYEIINIIFGPKHEHTSASLNNLATTFVQIKEYKKALPLLKKALLIDKSIKKKESDIARDLNNLGIVYRNTGQYEKARDYFQQALNIYKKKYGPWHTSVAGTLNNLGNALTDLKNYSDAENSLSKAMTLAYAIKDPNLSWHIWDGFRHLFQAQKKNKAAIFFGKQAVYTIQSMRNSLFMMPEEFTDAFIKSKAEVYRALANLLINEGRMNEAHWVLRMLKEEEYYQLTLSAVQRGGNTKTTKMIFLEAEKKWQDENKNVQHKLINLSKEFQMLVNREAQNETLSEKELNRLDKLESILDKNEEYVQSYIAQLILSFDKIPDIYRQKELSEKQLNTIKGIKYTLEQLGHNTVLIHYIVMPDCIHILLTTPEIQVSRKTIIDIYKLNHTVFNFRKKIKERKAHLYEAQLLYNWLIAPIESDLKQARAKVLMLSLDEMLRYAPFCAFHSGKKYLAQLFQTTVYTEAARDKIKILPNRSGKIAGVGLSAACPKYNLPALHAVPEEIETIVLNGPDDSSGLINGIVHLNESFSFKNFRRILRRKYSFLHIASHFVLVPGDEKSSFLILGDQTTINLKDIENKCDFNGINLLTLSACNTAMGSSGQSGREIEGFGALAQNNGAQSVLATLWAVNDESTGQFMEKFYTHFTRGDKHTKAYALQKAQIFFLNHPGQNEYRHPFFWAPFILMGNFL